MGAGFIAGQLESVGRTRTDQKTIELETQGVSTSCHLQFSKKETMLWSSSCCVTNETSEMAVRFSTSVVFVSIIHIVCMVICKVTDRSLLFKSLIRSTACVATSFPAGIRTGTDPRYLCDVTTVTECWRCNVGTQ